MIETWRPVPGYEGYYEVSDHGSVRSIDREFGSRHYRKKLSRKGKVIAQHVHWNRYKICFLYKVSIQKKFFVQRLVALAFIPNPENKHVVNHIDCNKANNHISNLEWMTDAENTQYYYRKRKEIEKSNAEF